MSERRKKPARKTRRFLRALFTLLHWNGWGGKQQGFYIPYRWAGSLTPFNESDSYDWLKERWDADQQPFLDSLSLIETYMSRLSDFASAHPSSRDCPRFDQSWCPGLDGAAAYSFVRELQPATIIEIGSGHSSRFMAQAIRDGGLKSRFISIDPQPRRGIDHLCSEVIRSTLDKADLSLFGTLGKNDILFFDGSHIAMPGTDVDVLINQVLPVLNSGAWVHIHDIFLPHGYPNVWKWRGYNEQSVVAALLVGGERFKVRFPSAYIRRHMSDRIQKWPVPLPEQAFETSLWLSVR